MSDSHVSIETTGSASAPLSPPGNNEGSGVSSESESGTLPRRLGVGFVLFLLVVGVAFLIAFFDVVRHWLALHTGTLHGGPDLYYNFWSGFGSDLGEATLFSAVGIGVYTGVRKVNCHTKKCWRIGHHPLEGTPYILCRHHHPDVPANGASYEHILEEHRKYKEAKGSREVPAPD
jgi:hypothetical protein